MLSFRQKLVESYPNGSASQPTYQDSPHTPGRGREGERGRGSLSPVREESPQSSLQQ